MQVTADYTTTTDAQLIDNIAAFTLMAKASAHGSPKGSDKKAGEIHAFYNAHAALAQAELDRRNAS